MPDPPTEIAVEIAVLIAVLRDVTAVLRCISDLDDDLRLNAAVEDLLYHRGTDHTLTSMIKSLTEQADRLTRHPGHTVAHTDYAGQPEEASGSKSWGQIRASHWGPMGLSFSELYPESPVRAELVHREHVQGLVDDVLWGRLTRRLVHEYPGLYLPAADRVLNETLGFLRLLAADPGTGYALSPRVGIGWHVFLLPTDEYAALCAGLAGRFLHHAPPDVDDTRPGTGQEGGGVVRTVAAMRARGLAVNEALWFEVSAAGTCCVGYAEEALA